MTGPTGVPVTMTPPETTDNTMMVTETTMNHTATATATATVTMTTTGMIGMTTKNKQQPMISNAKGNAKTPLTPLKMSTGMPAWIAA